VPRVSLLGDHKYLAENPQIPKVVSNPTHAGSQALSNQPPETAGSTLLTFGTDPRSIVPLPGYYYPVRILALPLVEFTQARTEARPVRDPSTPGDRRRYLAFLYSEYFCAAHRTDTLGGWSAILEHNPPWVAYLPLSPTLHAISCCHRALLLFLLLLYCYYKSTALSIPFGLSQQRLQDFGKPDTNRRPFDFLLLGHMCPFS
jgi:hypothetical protein